MKSDGPRPRWVMLAYQLPARPAHVRVRIWRRLQQIGAVVLRNSLYVLPNTDETREDLEWVRAEVVAHRGQASLLEAATLDGYTDTDLMTQLRAEREAEYRDLLTEATQLDAAAAGRRKPLSRVIRQRMLRGVQQRLAAVVARDHVGAPGRAEVEALVKRLEHEGDGGAPAAAPALLKSAGFKGRTWVTRPRPGVDRMASAWLIRRFIDPRARFVFSSSAASRGTTVPFDMADAEFGHHGASCTFETLAARFGIADAAVKAIGEVVHDLDLKETRFARPEAAAVGRIVEGLRLATADDGDLLANGAVMFEAMYRSFAKKRG